MFAEPFLRLIPMFYFKKSDISADIIPPLKLPRIP